MRSERIDQEMGHVVGGPDYRWRLAEQTVAGMRRQGIGHLDELTRETASYLSLCHDGHVIQAREVHPNIDAACNLFANQEAFNILKFAVLGTIPRPEIASRLNVDLDVISVAEALFFDLTGKREASSWMHAFVFVPEIKAGNVDTAARMRMAFAGGYIVARCLLDAFDGMPLEEAQRMLDLEVLLQCKVKAALELDLDVSQSAEFLKMYFDYDLSRRELDLERDKFKVQCQSIANDTCGDAPQDATPRRRFAGNVA